MTFKCTLSAGFALLTALTAQAQTTDPARFATERDSLFQHAAAIRSQADEQIRFFKTSFLAVRGTRRCTKSYSTLSGPTTVSADKLPKYLRKKHVVKFKRVGTVVEKVYYYTAQGNLALSEYYQDGKLVRLTASDYFEIDPRDQVKVVKTESGKYTTITSKGAGRNPIKQVKFLRGDYLEKTTRKGLPQRNRSTTEYFVAPRPQS
ncbi:hypothetical protein [Hymenobacter cellulosivorans]|uniref:Organic solvent tolerance-like N-terminal domain-containing protein n=1 Tax=Hymenobacter cellulosivorans TaxID=2932249 RepID=A0ABY4FBX6_9BACT|nr:hypothetical protein [Hymenobacter cellulosivorans]UOQ54173.1 hypothetical protein MUN80_05265 [Hymenobacter cellulosivorans]